MRWRATIALASAAALLTGCAGPAPETATKTPGAAAPQGLAALTEQAKNEGTLVAYGNMITEDVAALTDAFQAEYGLENLNIEYTRLTSAELVQRFQVEADAGRVLADLILTTDTSIFEKHPELFETMTADLLPDVAKYPKINVREHGIQTYISPFGIIYNTQILSKKDVPTSWDDLADPSLAGQIILNDPRNSPVYRVMLNGIREDHGDKLLKAIGKSGFQLTNTSPNGMQVIAAGGSAAMFPAPNLLSGLPASAPVAFAVPEGRVFGTEQFFALPSGVAHPSAARLFGNWLLTEPAWKITCKKPLYVNDASIPGAENCASVDPSKFVSISSAENVAGVGAYENEIYQLLNLR